MQNLIKINAILINQIKSNKFMQKIEILFIYLF